MNKKYMGGLLLSKAKIIFIVSLILLIIISGSYAYITIIRKESDSYTFTSGCLSITLDDKSDALTFSKAVPISDVEGLKKEAYVFELTNNCETATNYEINLESLNIVDNTLEDNHVRVAIASDNFDNIISTLNENSEREASLDGAYSSHNLYTGTLEGGASKTFKFREWMDYNTTNEEGTSKHYESKINVIAKEEIEVEEEVGITYSLVGNNVIGALNGDVSSVLTCESDENACIPDNEESIFENSITKEIKAIKLVKTSIGMLEVNDTVTKMVCSKLNDGKVICSEPYTIESQKPNFNSTSCMKDTNADRKETIAFLPIVRPTPTTCEEETNGLYEETTSLGKTYYYRGTVNNNWVKYGNSENDLPMWWRIIRINEDGTIRMIYAGEGSDAPASNVKVNGVGGYWISSGNAINDNASYHFNELQNYNAYVGYMYGTPSSTTNESCDDDCAYRKEHGYDLIDQNRQNELNSSDVKKIIDSWYEKNLQDEGNVLSGSTGFCGDRSKLTTIVEDDTKKGYGAETTYYQSHERVLYGGAPSYECSQSKYDLYTTSSDKGAGNGALTYPIGLITADEVKYAGTVGTEEDTGHNYGMWLSGFVTFTITPYSFKTLSIYGVNLFVLVNALVYSSNPYLNINPVVNVLPQYFKVENHDGTIENPYLVEV